MIKTLAAVLAVLTICLVGFFTITALTTEHNVSQTKDIVMLVKQEAYQSCVGGSNNKIAQLQIDYAIYTADNTAGKAGNASRATEASTIMKHMKQIAATRIEASSYQALPEPLSTIIRETKFVCPYTPPKPPNVTY